MPITSALYRLPLISHFFVRLSAGHRRLDRTRLPVGAECGSQSQRETGAAVHNVQLPFSSGVVRAAV